MAKVTNLRKGLEKLNRRSLPELALSILALVFTLAFALTPPDFSRAQITWEPAAGDDGGVFQLSRGWPEILRASTTCENIRAASSGAGAGGQQLILDTGGVKFLSSVEGIAFELENMPNQTTVNLPIGDCQVEMGFSSEKRIVYAAVDGVVYSTTVEQDLFPKITRLETASDQPSIVQEVTIVTQPTGIHAVGFRGIWGVGALIAMVGALFLFWRKKIKFSARVSKNTAGFRVADSLVAVFVICTAFLTPPADDDGWILTMVDGFEEKGVFSTYYDVNDAFGPLGYLEKLAFFLLRTLGLEVIHLRLFVAVIVIATWFVLRCGVIDLAIGRSNWLTIPAAGLYMSFAGSYLMTLRSEPFVALCVAIVFAALVKYQTSSSSFALGIGTFSTGVAASLHPSGMVSIVPWLAIAWLAWRNFQMGRIDRGSQVSAFILGAAASGLVLFLPFDLKSVLDSLAEFSSSQSHSNGIFSEISRYRNLLAVSGPFFFPVAALILFIAFGSFRFSNMNSDQRKLWVVAILSMTGLFLSGSKWVWHFGVYAVPGTILLALIVAQMSRKHPALGRQKQFTILLPALLFLVGVVFEQYGTWGALAWHSPVWNLFESLVRPSNTLIVWVFAIALLAAVGYQLDKRLPESRSRLTAGILLASLTMAPIMTTMAFLFVDSTTPGKWTAAQQNRSSFLGIDECGALGSSNFVESAKPLTILDSSTQVVSFLTIGGHPSLEGVSQGPLVGVPTWGTWTSPSEGLNVPDVESPNNHNFGKFVTPKFSLGNQDHIGVWSTTGGGDHQKSEVVFLDGNDEVISRIGLNNSPFSAPFDRVWHLNKLLIPESAASTYVEVEDSSTSEGGWTAVSSPSELSEVSAREMFGGKSSFTGPYSRTNYPCMELRYPLDGYWNEVEFVIPNAGTWEARKYLGLTLTQIGCDLACVFRVQYPVAQVTVTSYR